LAKGGVGTMSKIRNYDIDKLTFWIAEPGFIIGEGILGFNKLGGDQTPVQIDPYFYSMVIDAPCTVDSGLFVHREVRRMTLNAKVKDSINYDGKRIVVMYGLLELFYGTIRDYNIEEYWADRPKTEAYGPGTKTWWRERRVSITAMSGEENFARTPAPSRNFNGQTNSERLASYLGTTANDLEYPELSQHLTDNIAGVIDEGHLVYASDSEPSLLEAIRTQLRMTNQHYRYEPWESRVTIASNARWVGGTSESISLLFTPDEDNLDTSGGDGFVHDNRAVGFNARSIGKNSAYFTKGVTVTMTDSSDVTTTYGPYRASQAFPEDVDINIGRQSNAGEALARAFVATLPLRSKEEAFTYKIHTKLQSTKQMGVEGEGPGLAQLDEGIYHLAYKDIAILGVTHTVSRDEWTVDYECGPAHLITRESDKFPFVATDLTATQSAPGNPVRFQWTTPDLNNNQTMLVVIADASSLPLLSWTASAVYYQAEAKAPGVGEDLFLSGVGFGVGTHTYGVFYTTDPTADVSAPNSYIQGPVALVTITIT
jgi:hypothetical protein